ncbi:MAG TPA: two-component regulator propeller domain-containing protein, partial [Candidatus Baltobacteraceae bacterium]|nr:two-component regulator propeller domain-containing protein [Candidatus Baltobacteraceae bacterium]
MRTFVSFCAAIIFGFATTATAALTNVNWFARTWQMEDGLPNNNVNSLAQTPDGFLWVATPMGLARFDGTSFDEISLTNFIGLGNRGVAALLAGHDGGLWAEMDRGAVVDLNVNKTITINLTNAPFDSAAKTMIECDDGTLWFSYAGGAISFLKDGKATVISWQMGLPWASFNSIAKDTQGRIWLARAGVVGIFRNGRFQRLAQPGNSFIRLAAARDGGVWICAGAQLFHFDEGALLEKVGELPAVNSDVEPSAVIEDRHGGVWIGTTYNGLFRFDGSRIEKIPVSHPEISS